MNVFSFTSKHIAARIMAVMTLFALFTSLIPMQAFAANTYSASANPASINFNGSTNINFTVTNSAASDSAMKAFYIALPAGFTVSNIATSDSTFDIAFNAGANRIESSDAPGNAGNGLVAGNSAIVSATVTHTGAAPGAFNWTVCAFKNNSFAPAGGAAFDPTNCLPVSVTVATPPPVPCDAPYTGNQPNCVPPPCDQGQTGTYPNCVTPPTPCEAPYTGNVPDCVPPPCDQGQTGTYPNCVTPPPPSCSDGIQNQDEIGVDTGGICTPPPVPCDAPYTGNQPNCVPPPCDQGQTGTYPNCVTPPTPCEAPYTGNVPNCVPPPCEQGWTGTYPNCVPPVTPCPQGYTGTYPNCVPPNNPDPVLCTVEIVSDETNYVVETDANAVDLIDAGFSKPGSWVAEISGTLARWIWGDAAAGVNSQVPDDVQTFEKTFIWNGPATDAELVIGSDNQHTITLNGQPVGNTAVLTTFSSPITYPVDTNLIVTGENTLTIAVENDGNPGGGNPAGLLYSMTVTGNEDVDCTEVPVVDVCSNLPDNQATLPQGYVLDGNDLCVPVVPPVCEFGFGPDNLLVNGSFEEPIPAANGGQWEIFANIPGWVATNGIEVWNNLLNGASDGEQNVELDTTSATTITQSTTTVPGATYQLRFDFAARSGASAQADNWVLATADGNTVVNASTSNTAWTTYSANFVATDTTTDISFQDLGISDNNTGTLIDNAVLCKVSNPIIEEDTYVIYGYVWHDNNRNTDWDNRFPEEINEEEQVEEEDSEVPLEGRIITITNGEDTATTSTDADGYYEFEVPAGTWTITETLPEGWEHTYNESYEVTVPTPVQTFNLIESLFNYIIPTAHAAVVDTLGEYNFGNDETRGNSGGGGGGGGGSLLPPSSRTPAVRGDRTDGTPAPQPQVLGEQVSLVPVGAPDAGGGGTSPLSVQLPTLVAAFVTRQRLDV